MPCTGSENQDRGFVEDARSPPWDPARSRLMNSLDTTRREFLEAAAMTGGAFMGGRLIPSALTDDSDVTPFGPPPWFAPPLTWSGGGHGGSDHAARPVGGRFAARGGTDAGRQGGAPDAGDRACLGRAVARGRGRELRHGPADPARLGAPLQRRRARGLGRPAPAQRPAAAPVARAGSDGGRVGRAGAGPGARRRRALALPGPAAPDRARVRGRPARAHGGQAAGQARLPAPVGASAASPERPRGAGGFQSGFAGLVTASLPAVAAGKPVEIWFMDEARVGQQGTLPRVWAKRGTRPRALRDRRYAWAWLFGAVCPERGVGAAVVLPHVNIEAMNAHLAEIGRRVAEGSHAVLVLDRAGWHTSPRLRVPENISLLWLPPHAPESNPVEQGGTTR